MKFFLVLLLILKSPKFSSDRVSKCGNIFDIFDTNLSKANICFVNYLTMYLTMPIAKLKFRKI